MLLKNKRGNIFDSQCQCLCNPVNIVGVMGAGLAKQFKSRYPNNFSYYKEQCDRKLFKIGDILFFTDTDRISNETKIIANVPTKSHWRYPSQYTYIESAMDTLHNEIVNRNIKSVAIPPLGCGLGGLDVDMVLSIIESKLYDIDCIIEFYTNKDVA